MHTTNNPYQNPEVMEHAEAPARRNLSLWSLIAGSEATDWSRLLVRENLDRATRLALFQTCIDGQGLVLGAAQRAILNVTLAVDEDQLDMVARMQAVKSALLTRGNHPTRLQLTATTPSLLAKAAGLLGESIAWVDELKVVVPPDQRLPTPILASLACACPNLRGLSVIASPEALPRPQLVPKLKELGIRFPHPHNTETMLRSIAPYMQRFTSLTLAVDETEPPLDSTHVLLLLNPANVGTHLRTLNIDTGLDDTVLGLLLECAPALIHLQVYDVQLASNTHAHWQAAWQQLSVDYSLHMSSLARLPLTTGARLIMPEFLFCDMTIAPAGSWAGEFSRRFKEVVWHTIQVEIGVDVVSAIVSYDTSLGVDQAAALRVGLGMLHTLPTASPIQCITCVDWVMSPALLLELPLLPPWPMLVLNRPLTWLPQPEVYSTLLRLLPGSLREVYILHDGPALTPAHYESICLGAPRDRTPETSLHIKLVDCGLGVVEAIRHRMQQLGVLPNVSVSHKTLT